MLCGLRFSTPELRRVLGVEVDHSEATIVSIFVSPTICRIPPDELESRSLSKISRAVSMCGRVLRTERLPGGLGARKRAAISLT